MEDKKTFRLNARNIRDSLDISCISKIITENIMLWDKYQKAENVMLFYPIQSEISLLSLLNDNSKSFYFPSIVGDDIVPVLYSSQKGFKTAKYGISEPVGSLLEDFSLLDLLLIPALAVDKNGFRLGYGKGFYDRFLAHLTSDTVKAVPAPSSLVFENIPYEIFDKKTDYIITEIGISATLHLISNSLDVLHP